MTTYAVINNSTNLVENVVVWDGGEGWEAPYGYQAVESETAAIGWSYANRFFAAPQPGPVHAPTPEEALASNTAVRDVLLAQATVEIAPLQDAVDLDDATADETAQLTKWKQFRVAVNRVNLTQDSPTWPTPS